MKTGNPNWNSTLLAGCLALAAFAVPAGDLYKWLDEDGIWHFSDRPPPVGPGSELEYDVETVALPASSRQMVELRREGAERNPAYVLTNHFHGPVEVQLKFAKSLNVRSDPPLPARFVILGNSEARVISISNIEPGQRASYRLNYSWTPGPPLPQLPTDLDYYPPIPKGHAVLISQGFDGDHTHKDEQNAFAVDLVMPVGTPVLAARDGVVMDLEDDYHGGGQDRKRYLGRANYVRLLHDDGTMSVYAHLEPNSARVYAGGRVKAGQWIGSSGNTGYSSGPHLHFVVQINAGMSLQSLPFRFFTPSGRTTMPNDIGKLQGVLSAP